MGDFNQQIGPRLCSDTFVMLCIGHTALADNATSTLGLDGRRAIDHAVGEDLATESLGTISNVYEGRKLSDHFGVFAEVSAREF